LFSFVKGGGKLKKKSNQKMGILNIDLGTKGGEEAIRRRLEVQAEKKGPGEGTREGRSESS